MPLDQGERSTSGEWTLSSYFGKYLSNIEPSDERVGVISDAHTTLRDHLGSNEAQLTHPINGDFLSGSYARHTATGSVKDADIILPLQDVTLSEDFKEPSPRSILHNLKEAVDEFYDHVDLQQQRRSIQVFLSEDDVRMDLVPAIAPNGTNEVLYVPDYFQQVWIESNPRGHIKGSSDHNARTGGRYVPLVKALKWWRDIHIEDELRPKSFLLECIVRDTCPVDELPMAKMVQRTFETIIDSYGYLVTVPVVPDPALPTNDLSQSCTWTQSEFDAFIDACRSGLSIVEDALGATTKETAIGHWRQLFGSQFPESLTQEEEKRFRKFDLGKSVFLPSLSPSFAVSIKAAIAVSKGGAASEHYPARNGRKLPKRMWIRFDLLGTNVPKPYEIRWRVQNNGREARAANHLSHETFPGAATQWESTAYRGHHFMFCEIVKGGRVVARARHDIRIR